MSDQIQVNTAAPSSEVVTMLFMADEYIAGVLENARRLTAENASLRDKARRFKGWRVRYDFWSLSGCAWAGGSYGAPGQLLGKAQAHGAAAAFRKKERAGRGTYRNVRIVRVYRKAKL